MYLDQQQHLELRRDLCEIFNRAYPKPAPMFKLPEIILSASDFSSIWCHPSRLLIFAAPSKRILSLRDPTTKMSKSAVDPNSRSRILLTDSYDTIAKRIRGVVTDSIAGPAQSLRVSTRTGYSC